MWPECIASRGSQEIGSCLLKHFRTAQSQASHLIAFSDACGGQNRNINIACMWMHIVANPDFSYKLVDHKFMLSGHSYLPTIGTLDRLKRFIRKHSTYLFLTTGAHWQKRLEQRIPLQSFGCQPMTLCRFKMFGHKLFIAKRIHRSRRLTGRAFDGYRLVKRRHLKFATDTAITLWKRGKP